MLTETNVVQSDGDDGRYQQQRARGIKEQRGKVQVEERKEEKDEAAPYCPEAYQKF